MQLVAVRQALDRGDLGAVGLHRQQRTGLGGVAVDVDDAGAALAGVAADMGPGQAQVLAQELNEKSAGLDLARHLLAVRSEERRVGKECGSTRSSRGSRSN